MTFVEYPGQLSIQALEKIFKKKIKVENFRVFSNEKKKGNRVYNKAQLIDIIFKESSYVCMYFYNQWVKRRREREEKGRSHSYIRAVRGTVMMSYRYN
jgi:DNA-binding response OmpR family regulator